MYVRIEEEGTGTHHQRGVQCTRGHADGGAGVRGGFTDDDHALLEKLDSAGAGPGGLLF